MHTIRLLWTLITGHDPHAAQWQRIDSQVERIVGADGDGVEEWRRHDSQH